jgi:SAM-dependent methyltransferase/uncharacterized protein YbaR (Trm112 family)
MWSRSVQWLACPACHAALQLKSFDECRVAIAPEHEALAKEQGLLDEEFNRYIVSGALLCSGCHGLFPIIYGLPVLVPYTTPTHAEFKTAFADRLEQLEGYEFLSKEPVRGEQFVMKSFSNEWIDYDYDGVIWDLSYEDHEKRFLAEIGPDAAHDGRGGIFVEIGCGLGLTTSFAAKNLQCDALGVDLSLAVLRASREFKANPFLHFVQGSAFYLPLRESLATLMYSHGVLHHTYSTSEAVESVAKHCSKEGWFYLWLYGSGSKKGSVARRVAFGLEEKLRPAIAKNLESLPSRAALATMSYAYLLVNAFHRFRDPSVERYSYANALHAARDRFTPLFAHRHDFNEVAAWFDKLGFEEVQQVDWHTMPTSNQANYRRNTGVRGKRSASEHQAQRTRQSGRS